MKKIILFTLFITLATAGISQWQKPLRSISKPKTSREASFSIAIKGGVAYNYFSYTMLNDIDQMGVIGPLVGISLEKKQSLNLAVGIDILYAQRGTQLSYYKTIPCAIGEYNTFYREYHINYETVELRIPFTYYHILPSKSTLRPYVFIAPCATYVLGGGIDYKKDLVDNDNNEFINNLLDLDIEIGEANITQIQFGMIFGGGIWMRKNTKSSYFIMKLDAAFNLGILDSFTTAEHSGDLEVLGVSNYDLDRLGKRLYRGAEVTASLMIPIKKRLKGSCINWGEFN